MQYVLQRCEADMVLTSRISADQRP